MIFQQIVSKDMQSFLFNLITLNIINVKILTKNKKGELK